MRDRKRAVLFRQTWIAHGDDVPLRLPLGREAVERLIGVAHR